MARYECVLTYTLNEPTATTGSKVCIDVMASFTLELIACRWKWGYEEE